jgi:hypothetical protein
VGCGRRGGCGGLGVRSTARGRVAGSGLKVRNRAARARFRVRCCKRQLEVMERGGGLRKTRWLRWFGRPFDSARRGGGFWAKSPKLSHLGSVLGAPSQTAIGDGGETWWAAWYAVVVVVWPSV